MALLEVRGLYKEFIKDKRKFAAVNRIDLTLNEGECLGLVGESGCGKSTTAHLIARLLREDEGELFFQGEDLRQPKNLKRLRRNIQMIFQNPADSFDPRYTLLASVKQGLRHLESCGKEELEQRAREAISFVGLKESYHDRPVCQMSGGECQRAAIARGIIANPKLMICDEATSALDVSVQAQIVALLKRLQREKGLSYLFITHDLALAASMCDRIAVMYQGRIVEVGGALEVLHQPAHPYTKRLLSCVLPAAVRGDFEIPDGEALRAPVEGGCGFYPYCKTAVPDCAQRVPEPRGARRVACFQAEDKRE